jgi:hypothetical protein
MTLIDDKRTLRAAMLAWRGAFAMTSAGRRRRAVGDLPARAAVRDADRGVGLLADQDEIDIRPLMIELHNRGLPARAAGRAGPSGKPLLFRAWRRAIRSSRACSARCSPRPSARTRARRADRADARLR